MKTNNFLDQPNGKDGSSSSQQKGDFFKKLSDFEIWSRFKRGNEAAFNAIYQSYFQDLFSYALRFTDNREMVKDTIQDMFIELRQSAERLSDTHSIRYYLYRVMRNMIMAAMKKESKFMFVKEPTEQFNFDIELSHETLLINRQIDDELKAKLEKALNTLTKRQKEAMFYFYYKGMSYSEVADIMGLRSAKQSRNLIYKCLKALRSEIKLLGFTGLVLIALLLLRLLNLW